MSDKDRDIDIEEFVRRLEKLAKQKRARFDSQKVAQALKENATKFKELQLKLFNLMVEFGFFALKNFQTGQEEPLNRLQINSIVNHELDMVIRDLSNLEHRETIISKAEQDFYNGESEPLVL